MMAESTTEKESRFDVGAFVTRCLHGQLGTSLGTFEEPSRICLGIDRPEDKQLEVVVHCSSYTSEPLAPDMSRSG
jgi:hypothetical protein